MQKNKPADQNPSTPNAKIIAMKPDEKPKPQLYVGIGASAGGLEAIQTFFQNMPPFSSLAFVVIQHLSPDYKSMMVELLSKKTEIPVLRAEDGMGVEANHIYLIPPRKNLKIFHGKLLLSDQDYHRGINLPIDIFLQSLAEDQADRAAAIILSGTGSDGMRGIRSVKEQGGLVMVQNVQSAGFDGMPRAAISTGLADYVLPPNEMPGKLISYIKHPYVSKSESAQSIIQDETGLTRIFSMLRERFKIDFTLYKPGTLSRRIERRMTVNQIIDINEYAVYAQKNPSEVATLYREMLIGVTSFFRDPKVYAALDEMWLPEIIKDSDRHELRFWVAGCSTGEEAYSIAILARECMERLGISRDLKIFATDIDREAIAKAGAGIYPESIAADVSTPLLTKYFYKKDESFHIVRNIREMVVFAQHNLIKDPPFTHIDLISCRNLLIYLQPVLQRNVMDMFNFSLRPHGILMLGLSETVGEMDVFFKPIDNKNKIYRSRGKANPLRQPTSPMTVNMSGAENLPKKLSRERRSYRRAEDDQTLQRFIEALQGDYIPLAVIVNEQLEIQHVVGDSAGLFHLPSGRMINDLSKMVGKELAIPLTTGIQKVCRTRRTQIFPNINVHWDGTERSLKVTIRPLPEKRGQNTLIAVLIEETTRPQKRELAQDADLHDLDKETEQYLKDMENELQFTRENLQATIEELETANEELQATNEELLASNEELQSTNEELQSTNEELHTVNIEHQNKIIELTELNNDVENLLNSSLVGKLLLDDNMEVRRFSSFVKNIFNVLEYDIGRPLTHLTHQLINIDPVRAVQQVMESRKMLETEVQVEDGRWYFMRVLPYQVGPGVYSGTSLSFMDITELKQKRDALAAKNEIYETAQEIANIGNWEFDISGNRLSWSERVYEIFEEDPHTFTGTFEAHLEKIHPEDRLKVDRAFKQLLTKGMPYNVILRVPLADGRIKFVNEICRIEYDTTGRPHRCAGIVQDITQVRHLEDRLSLTEQRYAMLFEAIKSGVAVYRAVDGGQDFEILHLNHAAALIDHTNIEQLVDQRLTQAFPDLAEAGLLGLLQRVWQTGQAETLSLTLHGKDGIVGWREYQVDRLPTGEVMAVFDDVTDQKKAEESLELMEYEKRLILDNLTVSILHLDLDRKIKWLNTAAANTLGKNPEELIGKPCQVFLCDDSQGCNTCPACQAFETGTSVQQEIVDALGRRWHVSASPLINSSKHLFGVVEIRRPMRSDDGASPGKSLPIGENSSSKE